MKEMRMWGSSFFEGPGDSWAKVALVAMIIAAPHSTLEMQRLIGRNGLSL
jgi:hypothetical protein